MEQIFFEDISEGMRESMSYLVTEEMVNMFAVVSGDHNPVHVNADYAAGTQFKERIAHGALSSSFISAVLGTKLPGPGAIYMSQSVKFLAPVKFGDTVKAEVSVLECVEGKNRVRFETACFVKDKKVVTGEALVYVPSRKNI
ncbi:MaoC family dehydratase [Kordiimonas laminariae]|uniref:MaoC family dehydratase n=1 Tax=Kordiimonas laminariae TaxID=2917717 RepID=UPI001FF6B8D1|nr:MaoC family dehydratase [Kordiimonas laminariae]MCK0069098.1 MaoC family dehydratase [Kordiimonas laminariae]